MKEWNKGFRTKEGKSNSKNGSARPNLGPVNKAQPGFTPPNLSFRKRGGKNTWQNPWHKKGPWKNCWREEWNQCLVKQPGRFGCLSCKSAVN